MNKNKKCPVCNSEEEKVNALSKKVFLLFLSAVAGFLGATIGKINNIIQSKELANLFLVRIILTGLSALFSQFIL